MLGQEEHVYFEHTSGKLQGAVSMEKGQESVSEKHGAGETNVWWWSSWVWGGLKDTEEDEKPFSYWIDRVREGL